MTKARKKHSQTKNDRRKSKAAIPETALPAPKRKAWGKRFWGIVTLLFVAFAPLAADKWYQRYAEAYRTPKITAEVALSRAEAVVRNTERATYLLMRQRGGSGSDAFYAGALLFPPGTPLVTPPADVQHIADFLITNSGSNVAKSVRLVLFEPAGYELEIVTSRLQKMTVETVAETSAQPGTQREVLIQEIAKETPAIVSVRCKPIRKSLSLAEKPPPTFCIRGYAIFDGRHITFSKCDLKKITLYERPLPEHIWTEFATSFMIKGSPGARKQIPMETCKIARYMTELEAYESCERKLLKWERP